MTVELVRNALGFVASLPFRLVPTRMRFRAVMLAGFMLAPLFGPVLLRRYGNVVGSGTDETLRVLFRAMTRMRVRYTPAVQSADVDRELLPSLRNGGAVLVTAHFPINALMIRWLYDQGIEVSAIRETPGAAYVWGTPVEIDTLPPSQNVMLQMRSKLLEGRPLLLAIDRARPSARPLNVVTRFGETGIATPVFTLAEKLRLPVFFYGVRAVKTGDPILTVRRIPPDPAAFAEEFRRYTELMLP